MESIVEKIENTNIEVIKNITRIINLNYNSKQFNKLENKTFMYILDDINASMDVINDVSDQLKNSLENI